MPEFEILLPDPHALGTLTRFSAEAAHWMAALHICLEELEQPLSMRNALCELMDDGSVHITDSEGQEAFIRPSSRVPTPPARPRPTSFASESARWLGPVDPKADAPAAAPSPEPAPSPAPAAVAPAEVPDEPAQPVPVPPPMPVDAVETDEPSPFEALHRTPLPALRPRPDGHRAHRLASSLDALDDLDSGPGDPDAAIDRAVRVAWESLDCETVQCLVPEPDGQRWRVVAARGPRSSDLVGGTISIAEPPLSGLSYDMARPLHAEGQGLALRFTRSDARPLVFPVDEMLLVPVTQAGQRLALLLITCRARLSHVTPTVIAHATAVGERLGAALRRAS